MFTLKLMRARVVRLEEVARDNAQEARLIEDVEQTLLLPSERRAYLNHIYDAIAGLEAARAVMQKAVKRVESSPLSAEPPVDDAA